MITKFVGPGTTVRAESQKLIDRVDAAAALAARAREVLGRYGYGGLVVRLTREYRGHTWRAVDQYEWNLPYQRCSSSPGPEESLERAMVYADQCEHYAGIASELARLQ